MSGGYALSFREAAQTPESAGSKGVLLGRLASEGFRVPAGFVLTAGACSEFRRAARLNPLIARFARSDDDPSSEQALFDLDRIRLRCLRSPLPETARSVLLGALTQAGLFGVPLAVRSSVVGSGAEAAWEAGIHRTVLNVLGLDALDAAVRACWASLWTPRAVAWRRRAGIGDEDATMAVIVQRLVPADASGVAFTCDPYTGAERVVIRAVWGLGEGLASGRAEPDTFVLDPDGEGLLPGAVTVGAKAEMARPAVVGGLAWQTTSGDYRRRLALSDEQAVALGQTCRRIGSVLGGPAEVEWARLAGDFLLLQVRLMGGRGDAATGGRGDAATGGRGDTATRGRGDTATRGRGDGETRGHGDTATRGSDAGNSVAASPRLPAPASPTPPPWGADHWCPWDLVTGTPDAPSPFTWSLAHFVAERGIRHALARVGYALPRRTDLARRLDGRPCLNRAALEWALGDAFGAAPAEVGLCLGEWSPVASDAPDLGTPGPGGAMPAQGSPGSQQAPRNPTEAHSRDAHPEPCPSRAGRAALPAGHRDARLVRASLSRHLAGGAPTAVPHSARLRWERRWRRWRALLLAFRGVPLAGLAFRAAERSLADLEALDLTREKDVGLGDALFQAVDLAAHVVPLHLGHGLWHGAAVVRLHALLERHGAPHAAGLTSALLVGSAADADMGRLLRRVAEAAARDPQARHYFVGMAARPELPEPDTARARPAWKLSLAGTPAGERFAEFLGRFGHCAIRESDMAAARWSEEPAYPLRMIAALVADRRPGDDGHAPRAADAWAAARTCLGFLDRLRCRVLVRAAGSGASLRTRGRSLLIRQVAFGRRLALEIGQRMARKGVLERPEDVFFLQAEEIRPFLLGEGIAGDTRGLIAERRQGHAQPAVPAEACQDGPAHAEPSAQAVVGMGISPGRAAGPARVLRDPSEGWRLQRGEILVLPAADQAWAPVFLRAAGVIVERGGLLSAGASLARECGVPAVASLPGIAARISDGVEVAVDGSTGEVRLGGPA